MNGKPSPDMRSAIAGAMKFAGLGSGAVLAYFLLQMFTPEAIAAVLKAWGPGFGTAALLGGLVIWRVDKRFGEGVAAVNGMTKAQEGLTVSIGSIAESVHFVSQKDDSRAAATDAAIGFVAQQNEKIMSELAEIKSRLPK